MVTSSNVAAGSKWCRDCGGPITEFGGLATCANLEFEGQQLTPQDVCETLGPMRRRYCEHCRAEDPGPGICSSCEKRPL